MTAAAMTQEWDVVKRRRTFQNTDYTYEKVIGQVLSAYRGASWKRILWKIQLERRGRSILEFLK